MTDTEKKMYSGLVTLPRKLRVSIAGVAKHFMQRSNNHQAIFDVKMT
jgi:hypothetical protein